MFNNFKKISKTVIVATLVGVSAFANITPAAAQPKPPPTPGSCMWDGKETSSGGNHYVTQVGTDGRKYELTYQCQNGKWVYTGSRELPNARPLPTPTNPILSPTAQTGQMQTHP